MKKPKKKIKKNKYTKQKYPALNVAYQVGNRRELIDYDYLDKLSPQEKDWLDRFTAESIITNFNHRGDDIITDGDERRELYKENNRRNSDIFSVSKANGKLQYGYRSVKGQNLGEEETAQPNSNSEDYEDYLLTLITLKKVIKKNDQ